MTEVFAWNSFSCNNSSDYRLVAEFATPARAAAFAKELAAFFRKHAKEHDTAVDVSHDGWFDEPTAAALAFGEKYGHEWGEFLIWGDDSLDGDEPAVAAVGATLLVYHTYSSGGFGPDLANVIRKAGGKLPEKGDRSGPPILYGELALPRGPKGAALATALAEYFGQCSNGSYPSDWSSPDGLQHESRGASEDYTFWCDGARAAFTWPLPPEDLADLRRYFAARGAPDISLRLADPRDLRANRRRAEQLARAHDAAVVKAERAHAIPLPKLVRVAAPGQDDVRAFFGAAVHGDTLYLAGGRGANVMMKSKDGKKFVEVKSSGDGLRAITFDERGRLWAAGESGFVGYSTDGGKQYRALTGPGSGCVRALAHAAGTIWIGGDNGYLARCSNGKSFTRVNGINYTINGMTATPRGLLIASNAGLYLLERGKPRKLGLTGPVERAIITSLGTVLVAGAANTIHRSVDGGATFRRAKLPPFKQAKRKGRALPDDDDDATDGMLAIAALPDGRLVATGDRGVVLASVDDGKTFQRLAQTITNRFVTVAQPFGDALYLAGAYGAILRAS